MKNKRKINVSLILVVILVISFVGLSLHTNQLMSQKNKLANDVTNVEYLNASTQRLSRMVISNSVDDRLVFYVGEQTRKYLDEESKDRLYVVEAPDVKEVASKVIANWETLSELFIPKADTSDTGEIVYDVDSIALAADNHFDGMTDLSMQITKETESLTKGIERTQLLSYVALILITFIALSNMISTSIEMQRNRELAVMASLDIATGLYNRSKCQEILKGVCAADRKQQPAVVVIDLNDLKKTNDVLGHRVGDEMIAMFAKLLKQAANIHTVVPFLGRYGGDEFVVYHEDVENEEQLQIFVKELEFITNDFNKNNKEKFSISYAVGYAFNKDGGNQMTTRQLFDQADEAMYKDKKRVKEARAAAATATAKATSTNNN